MKRLALLVVAAACAAQFAFGAPEKIIFDTDMYTDFDDVGALATLHALADAGECEILGTVASTRGTPSVGVIEIVNAFYGRPDIPVAANREIGLGPIAFRQKAYDMYRDMVKSNPAVKHPTSDLAPDANEVYRRILAAQPDGSVTICSVGFTTNLRRLLETKGDAVSPLDGRALVAKKVKAWYAMACRFPDGYEYNSKEDGESSKIAFRDWPTPIYFLDWCYGVEVKCGVPVSKVTAAVNPVRDVFKRALREYKESEKGHAAWDEVTALAAVRGWQRYFNVTRGRFDIVDAKGKNAWTPDPNGNHYVLTVKTPKAEVGRIVDELMARAPKARAAAFKAGFARADITPPLGSFMPGYFKDRRAKEVLDPLQMNCVAFSDGKTTALVIQVDTEGISDSVADLMRDAIVKSTGVNRDAILVHASHTHDGGYLAMRISKDSSGKPTYPGNATDVDRIYVDMCVTRAADVALSAVRDLAPATLSYQRSEAKRISFGRRYLMKDGKVRTNPGRDNPDIVRPAGTPPDETVQVLRIDRTGAPSICVINFQTHPDVVGGETITADWPGLTRTVFEAATLGRARCMVINGTQGDVNHCNLMPRPGELNGLKRDFDAVDRGYDHAWHMANVVASAALRVWLKCIPLEAGEIGFATKTVRVPAQKAKDSDEKNLAWAKEVCAKHAAGRDAELPWKEMELTTEVARAARICSMANHADYHDLPIYAISVGKSLAFGGFPGEPFNDIGKAVKKASPFTLTILSCLTNGSRGYFPFSDSFKEGGYEAATSPFGETVADDLIKGQTQLLNSLHK